MSKSGQTTEQDRGPPPHHAAPRAAGNWSGTLAGLAGRPEVGALIPLVLITLVFAALSPTFLSGSSVATMLNAVAFIGIIVVGQTFLLVIGGLDLSVGSVAGLAAVVAAVLLRDFGWPVGLALPAGVAVGAVIGLANAILVVRCGIPAFIATLGMMYIARGIDYLVCNGYPIAPLPAEVRQFAEILPSGVSWALLAFITAVVVGDLVLRRTVFGRSLYAIGGNEEVARLAGIRTGLVKGSCYVLTGALAGLAGVLVMVQVNVGQPEIGAGWELDTIASVVIGGVSLFGGVGTVLGALIGLLIMQVVRSGLVSCDVSPHWQTVAVGLIMILAVGADLLRRRFRNGRT